MKTCPPTASATEFFRCAPTARIGFGLWTLDFGLQPDWQRRVAARAAQNHFAVQHHADNGIIHVPDNRAVVNQKKIGDAAEPFQRFDVRPCKSARRSNCRWWRRREISVRPSANDAADLTAASRRDSDCRAQRFRQFEISDLRFEIDCGDAAKQSALRASEAGVLQAAKFRRQLCALSSDGNISANGFSSRRLRSRKSWTAFSFRASAIK